MNHLNFFRNDLVPRKSIAILIIVEIEFHILERNRILKKMYHWLLSIVNCQNEYQFLYLVT